MFCNLALKNNKNNRRTVACSWLLFGAFADYFQWWMGSSAKSCSVARHDNISQYANSGGRRPALDDIKKKKRLFLCVPIG
jgi:hypothetical protein